MLFEEIPGQNHIKEVLLRSLEEERISHSQMFIGSEGSAALALAIAYGQEILALDLALKSEKVSCRKKCSRFTHPDLHFVFPVATNNTVKSHPVSNLFIEEWKSFMNSQPFGNVFDWYKSIGIGNKQGQIGVDESNEIIRIINLKPYESTRKVIILWMPEKMSIAAANKLLKSIEEPPKNTIFIFVSQREESVIRTIRSRCQPLYLSKITEPEIKKYLKNQGVDDMRASQIAQMCDNNINKAISMINEDEHDLIFNKWFVFLMRTCFSAKGNKNAVVRLIDWSTEIAKTGRETQKQFIRFCSETIRLALLKNYKAESLVWINKIDEGFEIEKFAPFIHSGNILKIFELFEKTSYHIERNGNPNIIFTDLSIQMARYLHLKEN